MAKSLSCFGALGIGVIAALSVACGSSSGNGGGTAGSAGSGATGGAGGAAGAAPSVAVLGNGSHSLDSLSVTVIGDAGDGLDVPRDLAFNSSEPNQLWVVNRMGPSVTVLFNADSEPVESTLRQGFGGTHFLAEPAALAFGAPGTFATAQEEDEVTQPSTPTDFMGPTLWPSDLDVFNAGHASHLDMMHNSPNSVGIAWERDNVYWVVDGYHGSLTRYDFASDHGMGGEDHSDGVVARYVEGQIGYLPDVPSHAELDPSTGLLYVADTGNVRIAVLDTKTGTQGGPIFPNYDGSSQYQMLDAVLTTLVDGSSGDLVKPSGLALHDGLVFVTDNETGKVLAYDLEGKLVDWLQTDFGAGALMGMAFDVAGRLYLVDAVTARVLRIAALPR